MKNIDLDNWLRGLLAGALAAGLAFSAGTASAAQPEDAWITTKVKMTLLTDDVVDAMNVNVDTFDGRVTLHGKVSTEAEKTKAEKQAKSIDGVREVRNLLAVVPKPAASKTEMKDDEVTRNAKTVLERDAALADSRISVKSVNDGTVVLAGTAATLSDHRRALEDARSVQGVKRVASEIQSPDKLADDEIWSATDTPAATDAVKQSAYDSWITTKAKVRLIGEPGLSPVAINVDTHGGVVTLFGSVETAALKERAEAQVKKVAGVRAVKNELQVVPAVAADKVEARDDKLLTNVQNRIEARESLSDSKIGVEVSNAVVRLTGTVSSQGDRLTALTVARSTPGVSSVIDELTLRPRS